jgi:glycine/D-amino acid oxidase-like deaminating enzyme
MGPHGEERALADAAPRCFWLDSPDRPEPAPPLEGDVEADLAIVGGGFTGLWAALQAREEDPGRDVVLLEATRFAEGASGRNGGFADPSICHGILNGLLHFPDEVEELVELGRRNFAAWVSDIERYAIDAHYEATGKLEVATAPHWIPHLREHFEALRRFGESAAWLDAEQTRAELDSPTYCAGLQQRAGGVVDPARLCWGLADAARRLDVRCFEGTPVGGLRRAGAAIELRCPGGRVRARKVLLATNAFRSPLRRLRRATIPVWDYALVTEPLSPSRLAALGWKRRQGVGDVSNQFHYYRLTADDRILWGGYDAVYHFGSGIGPEHEQCPESFATLSRHFFETFPQLEGLRFSHRWGGPIATTTRFCLDAGSAFGGRVSWATGYTGLGVGASRFGARVALDLQGRPDAPHLRLALVRKRPFPWPPEPLRYLAVQLTRFELARADRNQGRRGPWLRVLDRLGLGYDS